MARPRRAGDVCGVGTDARLHVQFDGIIGFSQGAAATAMLCAEFKPRFGILVAGFVPNDQTAAAVLLAGVNLCGKTRWLRLQPPPSASWPSGRQLSAPDHASGYPELRPASANQPVGPSRPAKPALFSTYGVFGRLGRTTQSGKRHCSRIPLRSLRRPRGWCQGDPFELMQQGQWFRRQGS